MILIFIIIEKKMTEEIWLPIDGHVGYEVSNYGHVRSYWVWRSGRDETICSKHVQRILKEYKRPSGYFHVKLKNTGNLKMLVSRIVALTFIPNPNNYDIVDHIDRNPSNNNVSNLRWCNKSQNNINSKIQKNNTSGKKGVKKDRETWRACWSENGIRRSKGFKTFEEASVYRDMMVEKHYNKHFYIEGQI